MARLLARSALIALGMLLSWQALPSAFHQLGRVPLVPCAAVLLLFLSPLFFWLSPLLVWREEIRNRRRADAAEAGV